MNVRKIFIHFKIFAETIKIEHTIFALPFAIISCFITVQGLPRISDFLWIIIAMVCCRTIAMLSNRLIDKNIDKLNPRTEQRSMVIGTFQVSSALIYLIIFIFLFFISVSQLHQSTWLLSPIPIFVAIIYSFLKRITWLCHFGIGLVYFLVPPAVQIAIIGEFENWSIYLGLAGALWVSGFDILYAIFDIDVDRKIGIKSLPAKFGISTSLAVTKLLHFLTILLLFYTGFLLEFGLIYFIGVVISGILLFYENLIVKSNDTSRLNTAFFTMNGVIAIIFLIFSVGDVFIKWEFI